VHAGVGLGIHPSLLAVRARYHPQVVDRFRSP
jgi:hypothetical protein